ncbi:hypothetical protein [Phocaeicola plebeius]|uniref:hypothetical protein n=1 Tax=Phocaeicola plebeius TaxID=310297 RepID=UPI00266CA538|nr:hypothetical protein [Phocaeicola plebeius]
MKTYRKMTSKEENFVKDLSGLLKKYQAGIMIDKEAIVIDVENASEEPLYLPLEAIESYQDAERFLGESRISEFSFEF